MRTYLARSAIPCITFLCTILVGTSSAMGQVCGDAGAGDCCIANGTPACDDQICCEAICAADPFCCATAWDSICAGEAAMDSANCPQCAGPGPGPNDNCADRAPIDNGATEFSNEGATDDGPAPCGLLGSDIWFNYNSTFTGSIDIDTCGSTFDTVLAVYDGCDCPADEVNLLA